MRFKVVRNYSRTLISSSENRRARVSYSDKAFTFPNEGFGDLVVFTTKKAAVAYIKAMQTYYGIYELWSCIYTPPVCNYMKNDWSETTINSCRMLDPKYRTHFRLAGSVKLIRRLDV
jgi:hypothetical protein